MQGILLLDKPEGLSSNQALQRVRRLLGRLKAGHTGSLDPLATGMLPICLGEATKVAGHLLGARKAYQATVRFGSTTTTADREGETLCIHPVPEIDEASVEALLARFRGLIVQRPPAYSALKLGGVPAYRLARQGVAVELAPREVQIHDLRLRARTHERWELDVVCGSGTYIRSLADDLGQALGCGAHLDALRRQWVDPFQGEPMVELGAIEGADSPSALVESHLRPIASGLARMPGIRLAAEDVRRLQQGQRVAVDAASAAAAGLNQVRIENPEGGLIGLGRIDADGLLRPSRLIHGE